MLLPFIPRDTSRSRLQAYALQAAALLKADRNAAIVGADQRRDAGRCGERARSARARRRQRSAFPTMCVSMRCCRRPASSGRRCRPSASFANGMSCGGTIALTRLDAGYEIRVNWLTGRVEIVPRDIATN